ncbi:MAG TPA: hypothetical protein VL096_06590, partial [Pirellulaceae bacterium]|nr:hypothetical protein [Pirellulaceae bacterium]
MHPLQQRVRRIASLAQRLRWQYALAAIVATLVGAVLVWGIVDYMLHVGDAGVRAIVSLAILLLVGYMVWRWVWPVMQRQPQELTVAQQIERHFPELGDRLSSSLAFLVQSEHDQTAGSATLRRAVVADTMARTERLEFGDVIDRRPTRRALLVASLLVGLAVLLTIIDPLAAKLVVLRTAWPWTTAAWPRRHELAFDAAPATLAVGNDLELAVIDQAGELPETVTLSYWFDGDRPDQVQTRQMSLLNGKMVHRLDNITRPFKYRAQGGDDTAMPWQELRVLEPPHVTSLTVKVIPPAYTGWPVATTGPDFRALEGSQVELAAQVDQPIGKAQLKVEGGAAIDVPVQVGDDGLTLRLPAAVDKPWILGLANAYTLELTSRDGLVGNDARYELRVVPDRPPVAAIEKPADNTLVTAQAIVPVRVLVKDDLAISRVELRYLRSDRSDEGEQVIPLYVGPERVVALASSPLDDGNLQGDARTFEYAWKLSELPGLAPGVTLTWHIAALDYKPQTGVGTAQRLVIISPTELDDRTAQRQSAILAQLHEVLRQQTDVRGQIAALEVQIANVQRLGKQDLDALLGAELNQRQVQRALSSETDGVLVQIAALLADLEINRVDSPDVKRRMEELASEIRLLTKTPLPKIEGELTTAQKLVRDDLDKLGDVPSDGQAKQVDAAARDATKQALTTAGQSQDEVIAALERLLGDLSQWDNYRRFAREISRLRGDQEELRKQTRELQPQLLSKSVRDLAPAELASLKQLAQRQTDVSRQFDKLLGRMTEARPKLAETQPLVAESIADALDAARRLGISSQMLDSA